jgi:hypothetical protein
LDGAGCLATMVVVGTGPVHRRNGNMFKRDGCDIVIVRDNSVMGAASYTALQKNNRKIDRDNLATDSLPKPKVEERFGCIFFLPLQ